MGIIGKPQQTEALILGGGPAGLSAAIWLQKFQVPFVLIERAERLGGSLPRINLPIDDFLGHYANNGKELQVLLEEEYQRKGLSAELNTEILSIDPQRKLIRTEWGNYQAKALILTLGIRPRELEIDNFWKLYGKGVSLSASSDLEKISGQTVYIVGGGDGALENALILADHCPSVTIVHRKAEFRGREEFIRRVQEHPTIDCLMETEVVGLQESDEKLSHIKLITQGVDEKRKTDWLVLKIGYRPNTDLIPPGSLHLDGAGYIEVNRYLHSSEDGVFAAGDIANPKSPSIAASVGDGAVVAREVYQYLKRTR